MEFIVKPLRYNKKITHLLNEYIQDTDLDDYIDLYDIQNYQQLLNRFDYRFINNLIYYIYYENNNEIDEILQELNQNLINDENMDEDFIKQEYDIFIEHFDKNMFYKYLRQTYRNIVYLNHYLLQLPKLNNFTDKDFILWRGISNYNHFPTGEIYIHPSFMSTTIYPEIAYHFTNSNLLFKLVIPKNKLNIFPLSYINDFPVKYQPIDIKQYIKELYHKYGTSVPEILIPLNSHFRLRRVYQTKLNVFDNYETFDNMKEQNITIYELVFISF